MTELVNELRRLLADPEEMALKRVHGERDAAVLVPLYVADEKLHAVFTLRRSNLRRHAGEISFPGGRPDEGETDLYVTALRETEEEIGLPRERVELVGALPPTPTMVTSYAIYPYVGLIEPLPAWRPSPEEVETVLEFSLAELQAGYARKRLLRRGVPVRTTTYTVGEHLIWGATARMLGSLLERLDPLIER